MQGRAMAAGAAAALLLVLAWSVAPAAWRTSLREAGLDRLLRWSAPLRAEPPPFKLVIVDIDRPSLAAVGPWPWDRTQIARLIAAVTAAQPAAVAVDLVLAGADQRSPAALARRLGSEAGRQDILALAPHLPDGDRDIAAVMDGHPVTLGWVMDPDGTQTPPPVPLLRRGTPATLDPWRAPGANPVAPVMAEAAAGHGTVSLAAGADGVVRTVPLLVAVGNGLFPGLAVDVLRLAERATALLVAEPSSLQIGTRTIALPRDGQLRLMPTQRAGAAVTLSAATLLAERPAPDALRDAIVIIGGAAPELGGLRASLFGPLTASIDIQARAVQQIAAGIAPRPLALSTAWEMVFAGCAGIGAAFFAARSAPRRLAAGLAGAAAILLAGALVLAARDILVDIQPALAAAVAATMMTSTVVFARTRREQARLRRRFAQHLSPDIVARILADPQSLRLAGERRIVTALFTDIEGFTALTRAIGPRELIAVLDSYFEGVSKIITAHGGMIDKFVGDAVHAFFNVPVDLEDHAAHAIRCATAIIVWTEDYRANVNAHGIALGRTRIGIESGDAVVGDVGLATKLDYTAHGNAVNLAARLEALNKDMATSILIGPVAAAASGLSLISLGTRDIRGFGAFEIHTVPETGGKAAPRKS